MTSNPEQAFQVDLTPRIREALTFQEYGDPPEIEGVHLLPMRKNRGENGWFMELHRLDGGVVEAAEGGAPFTLRQISTAWADPGRINAFHIHPKRGQNELWTVIRGQMLVWLVDCRERSSTVGRRRSVVLSGESPARLHIPAGVAHGYRAGTEGALLVYGSDCVFDRDDPDEGRLPWDHFGAELWEADRG